MFQYRQALVRLRSCDTVREIARGGLMGRDKLGELRSLALSRGWLTASTELPDDAPRRRAASTVPSVEPLREVVQRWFNAGVQAAPSTPP
jgi:hypothetical protein